jgi:aryl-alcohol dehydrogenase (NADP+)
MRKRLLGRTGVLVTEFAIGTMTFGQEAGEPAAHEILELYVEADLWKKYVATLPRDRE